MSKTTMAELMAALSPAAKARNGAMIRGVLEQQKRDSEKFDRALANADAPKREKDLQNQIEALLRRENIVPIRQRMDRRSNLEVGVPDILFSHRGRSIAWEVKLPGQKPQPEQVAMHERMRANGWRIAVVRSYAEAVEIFKALEDSPCLSGPIGKGALAILDSLSEENQ